MFDLIKDLTEFIGPVGQEGEIIAHVEALWRDAGLERDAIRLSALLEDPHPLARLVAACALHREETRGAHRRTDFPATEPALDLHHTVVEPGSAPAYARWS